MAYNPFNIFRRNQKAIFAVITVFIMFTFVLSSGLGSGADFFDWFPRWIGGKSRKGEHLATLDGNKIYTADVDQVRFRRVLANRFMGMAAAQAADSLQRTLVDLQAKATPDVARSLQFMMFQAPGMLDQMEQSIVNDPKSKPADKELVRTMKIWMQLMQAQAVAQQTGRYFFAPNQTTRDTINFMIWEKKADEMGIQYTQDDVKNLIQKEFLEQFRDDVRIREALQRDYPGRYSLETLMSAIGDEFRVRTAQTALIGPLTDRRDRTLSASPIFNPPYELFEFYREQTSPTTYQVLPVPASAFIDQVKATPTENELRDLFDKRKEYEPDPSREEPGFREPRKVKLEWVSATGEEPYYQKAAKAWVERTDKLVKSEVWGLTVPVPGMGAGAWTAMVAAPMQMKEPLVYSKYQTTVDRHNSQVRLDWSGFSNYVLPSNILDTSMVQPQNLAAAAGGAAGGALSFGNPLLSVDLFYGATVAAEQRARVRAGMPLMLGTIPGPGLLATAVGGEAAFRKNLPEPLSVETVKPELLTDITRNKARELAIADLKKLQEEVNKLSNNGRAKSMNAAKSYIAEYVKERGLKTGGTQDFESEWTIGDDPGMARLKEVLEKPGTSPHGNLPIQFGQRFFYTNEPGSTRTAATGEYKPEFYPEGADRQTSMPLFGEPEPVFLTWRTAEKQGRPLTFEEARARVVEAWKRQKARELARAEAERIANDIRNYPGASATQFVPHLFDLEAQLKAKADTQKSKDRVELFRIQGVAPMQIGPGMTGMRFEETARPFALTASKDIPYPTQEMQTKLIEERTKPPKTTFVLPDQPRDTYYVFVVADRQLKTIGDFEQAVYGGPAQNNVRVAILQQHVIDAIRKAQETILTLLKREFNYEESAEQTKLIDERGKQGGE